MATYDWLRDLCNPQRIEIAAPCAVDNGGAVWTVATDGHRAVILSGEHGFAHACGETAAKLSKLFGMLPPITDTQPLDLDGLRAFLRVTDAETGHCVTCKDTGRVECETCEGEGGADCECLSCGHVHEAECKTCKGAGDLRCPSCKGDDRSIEPVRIGGVLFNRQVMLLPLRYLRAGAARIAVRRPEKSPFLPSVIYADDWTLLVMPLREEGMAEAKIEGAPRFDLAPVVAA